MLRHFAAANAASPMHTRSLINNQRVQFWPLLRKRFTMSSIPPGIAQQPPLPPADTFDILPALHELLSRIDHQPDSDSSHPDIVPPTSDDELTYSDTTPLEPRELPTEVLSIKAKIRRALKELEKLADMDRSVEQQEQEIKQLEQRIERQRDMLKQMATQSQSLFVG